MAPFGLFKSKFFLLFPSSVITLISYIIYNMPELFFYIEKKLCSEDDGACISRQLVNDKMVLACL